MTLSEFIKTVAFGVPVGITVIDLLGYVARVDGVSMQPALNPGKENDYVFLSRISVRLSAVSRGDVVAILSPKDKDQKLIKRVIGLGGDTVRTLSYRHQVVTVPKGHCWVEGDNAKNSMDSNLFGPISSSLITAKATAVVWPPSRWQAVKNDLPKSRLLDLNEEVSHI